MATFNTMSSFLGLLYAPPSFDSDNDGWGLTIHQVLSVFLVLYPLHLNFSASGPAETHPASRSSTKYVLFNLVSATQQLTIGGLYEGFGKECRAVFIWSCPLSIIDWVNLADLLVV